MASYTESIPWYGLESVVCEQVYLQYRPLQRRSELKKEMSRYAAGLMLSPIARLTRSGNSIL
jgi:hypothetical protein